MPQHNNLWATPVRNQLMTCCIVHLDQRGGEAKVSCILRHQGIQLRLAYSWAKPAVLAAGKGRGGMFLFLLLFHFHSFSPFPCPSLLFPLHFLLSLFFLSLGEDTKWHTRVDTSLNPNTNKNLDQPAYLCSPNQGCTVHQNTMRILLSSCVDLDQTAQIHMTIADSKCYCKFVLRGSCKKFCH